MEVAARSKGATFKLSCQTQAKRKKYRLTRIAFPHGNEPFKANRTAFHIQEHVKLPKGNHIWHISQLMEAQNPIL